MTPSPPQDLHPPPPSGLPVGTRLLLTGACAVILIAGLRAASSLLIPILLAGLLALLCFLPMRAMQRRGVPRWLAVVVVILGAALSVFAVVAVGQAAVDRFSAEEGGLATGLSEKFETVTDWLVAKNVIDDKQEDKLLGIVDPSRIMGLISGVTSFGIFVELDYGAVSGLVHVTGLPNDYYHFDPVAHRLTGERRGLSFQLADRVRVRVSSVNVSDRKVDFELVD